MGVQELGMIVGGFVVLLAAVWVANKIGKRTSKQ